MRSIIWDLGGTLMDTYPDVDRALAASAYGADPTDVGDRARAEVAALTRISSGYAIKELARRHEVPEKELRSAYDGVKARWTQHPAPVMDGAREVMAAVRGNGGLNLVATHRDRISAEQLLVDTGLSADDVVCAPDGYHRKPSPQMYQVLMERHALDPSEVLAVGDRPVDVEAADAAGITGVLLITPGIPLEAGGSVSITSLTELLAMVEP